MSFATGPFVGFTPKKPKGYGLWNGQGNGITYSSAQAEPSTRVPIGILASPDLFFSGRKALPATLHMREMLDNLKAQLDNAGAQKIAPLDTIAFAAENSFDVQKVREYAKRIGLPVASSKISPQILYMRKLLDDLKTQLDKAGAQKIAAHELGTFASEHGFDVKKVREYARKIGLSVVYLQIPPNTLRMRKLLDNLKSQQDKPGAKKITTQNIITIAAENGVTTQTTRAYAKRIGLPVVFSSRITPSTRRMQEMLDNLKAQLDKTGTQKIAPLDTSIYAKENGLDPKATREYARKIGLPIISAGEAHGNNLKKLWKAPAFRECQAEAVQKSLAKLWQDEDFRKRQAEACSKNLAKLWQDDGFRKRQAERASKLLIELRKAEWYREFQSKRMLALRKDENFMKRLAEGQAKRRLPPITIVHLVNGQTEETIDIADPDGKTPLDCLIELEEQAQLDMLPDALDALREEHPAAYRLICREFGFKNPIDAKGQAAPSWSGEDKTRLRAIGFAFLARYLTEPATI